MSKLTRLGFVAALGLTLSSCNGGSADPAEDGFTSLQSGDHAAAVSSFDKALAGMDTAAADYMEVATARCRALAHTDATKAKSEFLALNTAQKSKMSAKDFSSVVSELMAAEEFVPAIEIMDVGLKQFPEEPAMQTIKDKVIAAAQSANNAGALDALKGLGYL